MVVVALVGVAMEVVELVVAGQGAVKKAVVAPKEANSENFQDAKGTAMEVVKSEVVELVVVA